MAQELKNEEVLEGKYDDSDDDYVNQEVIVNDHDLRVKVTESDERKESVFECIGYLRCDYIYDTNSYRISISGTATVFHVGSKGETFAVTCAHNVRRLVYECGTCGVYMDEKAVHGKCDVDDLCEKLIKANAIKFIKKCVQRRKLQPLNNGATEVIEYGDTEMVYECDVNNIFLNEKMYSLYPNGSSGYDLCVLKFERET
eukprot:424652_1